MNSREQFLLKRVRELEARLLVTMQELQRVALDRDFTESVGCAFAWDLAVSIKEFDNIDDFAVRNGALESVEGDMRRGWDAAVKATEAMLAESERASAK